MKKLGTFMGVNILIDSDDETIVARAVDHLDKLTQQAELLQEWKTELEAASFAKQ